ncbi:glycosyltransferase, partial [Nocardia elegans]|uniref:glycosyltransferase n=1 Tax=Nocardia elegans TaxID=300029 RepID=UPI002B4ABE60
MRVAIVSESFLPNMNGVVNSVLRVLDHLSRHGHQALVIAPDTPRGLPPAPREHGGVPVYRVPAVMVPKISSLPVGLPQPGITDVIADFDADVVHLASPFLLGAGGLAAALRLDLPTVAVYQTDVAGFAQSYGLGLAGRAAWGWTRRIHLRATRTLAPSRAAAADSAGSAGTGFAATSAAMAAAVASMAAPNSEAGIGVACGSGPTMSNQRRPSSSM